MRATGHRKGQGLLVRDTIDFKKIERDAGGKPLRTFPHPALAPNQPDDQDTEGKGDEPSNPHNLFRHIDNFGGQPLCKLRQATVEDAFDNQNKADSDD